MAAGFGVVSQAEVNRPGGQVHALFSSCFQPQLPRGNNSRVTCCHARAMLRPAMNRATEAFISSELFDLGQGYVVFTRFRGGEAELGVFLVDVFCLGVKDAFYTRVGEPEYEQKALDRMLPPGTRKPLTPSSARKLVEDAVAYARRLGFAPHPDYKLACRVFGGTDAAAATDTFAFGQDGKPCYIQGKFDSPEQCLHNLKQLRAHCGDGNFDFLVLSDESVVQGMADAGFTGGQKVPKPPVDLN